MVGAAATGGGGGGMGTVGGKNTGANRAGGSVKMRVGGSVGNTKTGCGVMGATGTAGTGVGAGIGGGGGGTGPGPMILAVVGADVGAGMPMITGAGVVATVGIVGNPGVGTVGTDGGRKMLGGKPMSEGSFRMVGTSCRGATPGAKSPS